MADPAPPNFTCSGANLVTQTINAEDATVVTITGDGALSYTDVYMSSLTADQTGLFIRSTDDSDEPGSVTINTNGAIEGNDDYDGIYARNDGSGAISITANGTIGGEIDNGIYARNAGTSLSVVTGGTIEADDFGIQARNYGGEALTIETRGRCDRRHALRHLRAELRHHTQRDHSRHHKRRYRHSRTE